VERAAPLPVPEQHALHEQMGLVTLEFQGSSVRVVKAVPFRDRTSRLDCEIVPPPQVSCPEQDDKRAVVSCYAAGVTQRVASVFSACGSRVYPSEARKKLWEGKATVELLFGKQGVVRGTRVAQSSGYEVLDQRAIELVEAVNLAPPAPMLRSPFVLRVPVVFKLKDPDWFRFWPRGCPPDASESACPKSDSGPNGTSRR
jgi:TonB family protein